MNWSPHHNHIRAIIDRLVVFPTSIPFGPLAALHCHLLVELAVICLTSTREDIKFSNKHKDKFGSHQCRPSCACCSARMAAPCSSATPCFWEPAADSLQFVFVPGRARVATHLYIHHLVLFGHQLTHTINLRNLLLDGMLNQLLALHFCMACSWPR